MSQLDLRLGNPDFLRPYWRDLARWESSGHTTIPPDVGISYEKDSGNPALRREILRIHSLVGNVSPDGCSLIVGQGATQLIVAALRSLPGTQVGLQAPYYFMFPDLIRSTGKEISPTPDIDIVVDPSNPLNVRASGAMAPVQIHDLSYNWPTYGQVFKAQSDIMICSMAKATGHCASRIGWAFVRDPAVAQKMLWQIELSTGGVAYEAQMRAAKLLSDQAETIENGEVSVFRFGNSELEERWSILIAKNTSNLAPINYSGMFAWCTYPDRGQGAAAAFSDDFNALTVPGPRCGGDAGHLRINMGCSRDLFDELIRRISA